MKRRALIEMSTLLSKPFSITAKRWMRCYVGSGPGGKKSYRISQGVNIHIFDAVFRTNHKLFCYNNNTIVPLTEP